MEEFQGCFQVSKVLDGGRQKYLNPSFVTNGLAQCCMRARVIVWREGWLGPAPYPAQVLRLRVETILALAQGAGQCLCTEFCSEALMHVRPLE